MAQPTNLFYSRTLGRNISPDHIDSIDPADLEDLCIEVNGSLMKVNAEIKNGAASVRAGGRHLPPDRWAELQSARAFLGNLHQQLLVHRGRYSRQEREQRHAAAEAAKANTVPDLPHYFQQVVRNESRPADYQRWVLQAEMRRSADLTRIRKKELRHA